MRSIALLCLLAAPALAAPSVWFARRPPAKLVDHQTVAQTSALLVEARWVYLVPDKRTSTYESKIFALSADGTVEITTMNADGPTTRRAAWKTVAAAAVEIAGHRYTLRACDQTVCLEGPLP